LRDVGAQNNYHGQHGVEQQVLRIKEEISDFGEMQIDPKKILRY